MKPSSTPGSDLDLDLDLNPLFYGLFRKVPVFGEEPFLPGVASPMELLSGAVIDQKYRLGRLLGEGGMGAVYEADDLRDGSIVAVKLLRGTLADPAALQRFEREARALYELRHESLVRVLDYAAHPSHAYFVMELAPGVNLGELVAIDGALRPERVARIALAVLGALGAAHARGIIHRDVKPQNIQVSAVAGGDAVRLLDFGLAKDLGSGHALTQEGMVVGTMQYMAPEQAKGLAVDSRADVYAVGACMYYALTGRRPFEGQNGLPLYRAVLSEAPKALASIRSDLSPMLIAIVERALAKEPAKRFRSAEDLSRALTAYLIELAIPFASSSAIAPSHRGHTVPLSAVTMMSAPVSQPNPSSGFSNEAITIKKHAPMAPPDTPVPDTTPSGPPPDACPPTQRSGGKGALLASVFVLVSLLLAVGGAAMVRAGGPSRIYAAIPR